MDIQPTLRPPARRTFRAFASTVLGALLACGVAACGRPADRPVEGARPGSVASANSDVLVASSPVPLAVPTPEGVSTFASPAPSPPPSPVPSPTSIGRGPIISTIQPPANASVPVGPVTISTRISATSDITEATLLVDGQAARYSTSGDARTPTYTVTMNLPAGQHQARITVRDDQGRAGGFTWTFTVGGASGSPAAKR